MEQSAIVNRRSQIHEALALKEKAVIDQVVAKL